MENGRCYLHGGKSHPGGPGHPKWKTGEHSRYRVPARMIEQFRASMDDPDLASLRSELALMDSMVNEVLSELDGVDAQTWPKLVAASRKIQDAATSGDRNAMREAIEDLQELIAVGGRHAAAVLDVSNLLEKRSRIASREHKRMVDLDTMVRFEQFLAIIILMMSDVRQYVRDPETIARIASSWEARIGTLPGAIESSAPSVRSGVGDARPDAEAGTGGGSEDSRGTDLAELARRAKAGADRADDDDTESAGGGR